MMNIGFLGLGTMGSPMAVNIARTGLSVMVCDHTGGKAGPALGSWCCRIGIRDRPFRVGGYAANDLVIPTILPEPRFFKI